MNPSSVIFSGIMMFRHLGWHPVAELIETGIEAAIAEKVVTYDFARLMEPQVDPIKCSEFGQAIVDRMGVQGG